MIIWLPSWLLNAGWFQEVCQQIGIQFTPIA
jgi:hypothetical protein